MQHDFSVISAAMPDTVFKRLKDFGVQLPPGSRFRPAHVTGVQVEVSPPRFTLQCTRAYREYLGPVCEGRVMPEGSGSLLRCRFRRNRGFLIAPLLALPFLIYTRLNRSGLGSGTLAAILIGALLLTGWCLLLSLFSSEKHEAEVDALVALVRTAAGPASDDKAGV